MSLLTPLTSRFTALRSYTGSLAWGPLVQFSRSMCLSLLKRVEIGRLEIIDTDGTRIVCGTTNFRDGEPQTTLEVNKDTFWVRLMLFADMVS
jgi:cyclopropane-fatty-acyl-phospholipid synthase